MVPINRRAAPRGNRVSASSVMTYRTEGIDSGRYPPTDINVVPVEPRSS